MNWKSLLRTLAHGFVSSASVGLTAAATSGKPLTSGNVLLPALIAGLLGGIHAAFPSTIGSDQQQSGQ
jgi:hypothetical protein